MAKVLLLEGYVSNFTYASYSLLYVEFNDFYEFYVNQSLAGQTIATVSNEKKIFQEDPQN
jgi:hypothetical protein